MACTPALRLSFSKNELRFVHHENSKASGKASGKTLQQLAVESDHKAYRALLVQHEMPPPEALSIDGLYTGP